MKVNLQTKMLNQGAAGIVLGNIKHKFPSPLYRFSVTALKRQYLLHAEV
ncbi:MAG: hypothetical protein ACI9UT_002085 [Flavobacteriales bacterium]|jgi:hypothetical protein